MKFIYIAPLLLLVPAVAGAQTYYYEGTLTFRVLTGKDCGETKVGDTRTLQLVVTSSGKQISGYTLVQGGLPGRYSGEQVDRLVLEYPDPQQATGHAIALNGIGAAALTGEVREKSLQPNEPGCNFSRAEIAAQQMADGAKAEELQSQFINNFQGY
ncbi:MAG: hypothetical protein PHF75_07480, partial [Gallionella sp.]|nr:hypothetical protein [Gallionella sp.]